MFLSSASHHKNSNVLNVTTKCFEASMKTFIVSFYHDCIITIPHDSDAHFGLELNVNSIFFHLNPSIVVWNFDTVKK